MSRLKKNTIYSIIILCISMQFFSAIASAQVRTSSTPSRNFVPSARNAENIISENTISNTIEFLTDSLCEGRRTSTKGALEAAFYIERRFRKAGLLPVSGSYSQSFQIKNEGFSGIGHNVIGVLPGVHAKDGASYIIVAAHYDNLGTIDGKMYPGADSNASGVATMLSILDMVSYMNQLGKIYNKNILFVGFDAKELSMAGSQALWNSIANHTLIDPSSNKPITKDQIFAMVNIDIIGSSLAPLKSGRKDYMLMLSGGKYTSNLSALNKSNPRIGLDLAFDYYGSAGFTRIFYNRIGDQKVFLDNGIPSILFTSGITMETNKESDTLESLNLEVLKKRTWLIFYWLDKML